MVCTPGLAHLRPSHDASVKSGSSCGLFASSHAAKELVRTASAVYRVEIVPGTNSAPPNLGIDVVALVFDQ